MPYAPEYHPKFDLKKAQNAGDQLSATELRIELANIANAVNQNIAFMRAITTANMKIQPNQIMGTTFVIEDEQTATGGQTTITYANGVTVNPLTATVGVFINGDRLPASQTTVESTDVIVPALTAGDSIMLEIHDNADSVFSTLGSILNAEGASLVGIEDIAGIIASSNVEGALAENRQLLDDTITAIGDLTKYLKADSAVPLEIDQDANGFTWKNLPPAVDPNDPVILQQIDDVLAILTDLGSTFLALAGGVMQGPINMAGQRIINLPKPVADTEPLRKVEGDAIQTDVDSRIPTLGLQDPDNPTAAQNIGTLDWSQDPTASATVPQDGGAAVKTATGLPKPASLGDAVNLQKLNEVESALTAQITTVGGGSSAGGDSPNGSISVGSSLGGCDIDGVGVGSVGDIDPGGVYNFESMNVVSAQTPTDDTFIFNTGDVSIGADISASGYKLEISATGDVTIDLGVTLTCKSLIIRAGGNVIFNGAIIAEGNVFQRTNLRDYGPAFGPSGFVYIGATGSYTSDAASTISTAVCSIQAGASSVAAGTITGLAKGRAFYGSNSSPLLADLPNGNTFGKKHWGSANPNGLGTIVPGRVPQDAAIGLIQGGNSFVNFPYAGEGGVTYMGAAYDAGGGGGGGGTAGGDGGNGAIAGAQNGRAGVAGGGKGSFKPFLLPLAPGGGGALGVDDLNTSAQGGEGGGVINIYVVGDLDATGLSLVCNASDSISNGATTQVGSGGGGGGAIRVVCSGALNNGTGAANGGAGSYVLHMGGGGGGGGSVHFVADSFTGVQSRSVAGGAAGGGGSPGSAGSAGSENNVALPSADILCLAGEGYWSR